MQVKERSRRQVQREPGSPAGRDEVMAKRSLLLWMSWFGAVVSPDFQATVTIKSHATMSFSHTPGKGRAMTDQASGDLLAPPKVLAVP
ncbi:hypothetical protein [Pseudomonas sp. MWU349]|uniref:hypothetical protein n=1 Tax=Pseudomonas sp. MWU349 TaxID=2802572 RepID=UPI001B337748|nr:hypothetical protein [Pseudomonas sp. MWU349]